MTDNTPLSEKVVWDGRHPDYDVDVCRVVDIKQALKDFKEKFPIFDEDGNLVMYNAYEIFDALNEIAGSLAE